MAIDSDRRSEDAHAQLTSPPAPVGTSDVYAVLGGGWRAICECGETLAVATQEDGWDWVLAHPCA